MIIITRSNEIYSSPRIEKYIDLYNKESINYLAIGWDRNDQNIKRKSTIYFRKNAGYNIGGYKAAINRSFWMLFLLKILIKNRKKITHIHAFDLDTAFPAALFKTFIKNKTTVIFDVCDWFSATLYNQRKFFLLIFRKMESFTIKHSDEIIVCEPERVNQIPYKLNRKELVVPNIPIHTNLSHPLKENKKYQFNNNLKTISYVGGFSKFRMLDELINIAERGTVNLLIAGYGQKNIEDRCKKASYKENIKYFGKVSYNEGLNIMYNSDIIYAMYSKSNPNHFYAAPNKYYEAMMLGKPLISTKGISLGEKILKNGIGYIVEEVESNISDLIISLNRTDMKKKGETARTLWENKFKTTTKNFLHNKYLNIIKHKK